IRAVYRPAASPAGPPPTMTTSYLLTASISIAPWELVFLRVGLAKLVLGAKASARAVARDVVVRAPDRTGAALDAVVRTDQRLLLLLVPLVDAGRAEVRAELAFALVGADRLVDDLDVRPPGVLFVLDREQLIGELFHQALTLARSEPFPDPAHEPDGVDVVGGVDVFVRGVDAVVWPADPDGQHRRHPQVDDNRVHRPGRLHERPQDRLAVELFHAVDDAPGDLGVRVGARRLFGVVAEDLDPLESVGVEMLAKAYQDVRGVLVGDQPEVKLGGRLGRQHGL